MAVPHQSKDPMSNPDSSVAIRRDAVSVYSAGRQDRDDDDEQVEIVVRHRITSHNLCGYFDEEAMQRTACRQLEVAIDLLPPEAKSSFAKAKDLAPRLIWEESNPIKFLRFESYNCWAAALRLTTYWTIREEVFGSDHAFRPLNLYDDTVFGEESPVEDWFRSEAVMLLPPDNQSRVAIFCDRSKIVRPDAVRLKSLFIFLQMLAENDVSDYSLVFKLENPLDAKFHKKISQLASDLMMNALPIHRIRLHLLCNPPKNDQNLIRNFFDFVVPLALRRMGSYIAESPIVHVVDSEAEVLSALLPYGFKPEGLPHFLGGSWNPCRWYEKYQCTSIGGEGRAQGSEGHDRTGQLKPVPEHAQAHLAVRASPEVDLSRLVRTTLASYTKRLDRTGTSEAKKSDHAGMKRVFHQAQPITESTRPTKRAPLGSGPDIMSHGVRATMGTANSKMESFPEEDAKGGSQKPKTTLAFYAKQRRQKEKERVEGLEKNYSDEKLKQVRLLAENERLQGLVNSAVSLVERHENRYVVARLFDRSLEGASSVPIPWTGATSGWPAEARFSSLPSVSIGGDRALLPSSGVEAASCPGADDGTAYPTFGQRFTMGQANSNLASDYFGDQIMRERILRNDLQVRDRLSVDNMAFGTGTGFFREDRTSESLIDESIPISLTERPGASQPYRRDSSLQSASSSIPPLSPRGSDVKPDGRRQE